MKWLGPEKAGFREPALSEENGRTVTTVVTYLAQGETKPFCIYTRNSAFPGAYLIYLSLLAERLASGLLEPFRCARCEELALDPVGWNGPKQPLCELCADTGPKARFGY